MHYFSHLIIPLTRLIKVLIKCRRSESYFCLSLEIIYIAMKTKLSERKKTVKREVKTIRKPFEERQQMAWYLKAFYEERGDSALYDLFISLFTFLFKQWDICTRINYKSREKMRIIKYWPQKQ